MRTSILMPMAKTRQKVLFVIGNFEMGGAENQALQLALFLKEKENWDVEFLGFGGQAIVSDICNKYGIPWKSSAFPWSYLPVLRYFQLKKFEKLLKGLQPDIIISYVTYPNVFCALTWEQTGARLCIWNQRDVLEGIIDTSIEKEALQKVPLIISNSFHGKDFLVSKFNVNPAKIAVVWNSIRLNPPKQTRSQWRDTLGAGDSTLVVCMVANLTEYKDHTTLLHAWNIINNRYNKANTNKALLVLAGRLDTEYRSLVKLAEDLDLQNSIKFLGPVEDISGLLSATDIGVLSSISEGCPNSVLEYMASGLPVVATDVPGTREVIPDSQQTFLFPPSDSSYLANLLIKLMEDPELRQRLGEWNKQQISDNFDPGKNYMRLIEIVINNL